MTTIITKNSSTTGAAPTSGDLVQGELAVNVTDTGLYTENASGTVVKLNAPSIDDKNTGATKYVTIASGGNVGIGTSSPSFISGYSGVQINSSTGSVLHLTNSTTGAASTDGFDLILSNSLDAYVWQRENANLIFGTNATERIRIDSSGNVGIGTNTPNTKLQVDGIIRCNAVGGEGGQIEFLNTTNNAVAALVDVDAANNTRVYALTNNPLIFGTNSTERMRIDSSGYVGIGTNSPSQKLTVDGRINIISATADADIYGVYVSSGIGTALATAGATSLVMRTNNTERMRIDSSGNLLVGTTSADPIGANVAGFAVRNFGEGQFSRDGAAALKLHRKSNTGALLDFFYNGPTNVGNISTNGSTVTFSGNALSDARYKENVAPINNALDAINAVDFVTFNYKANGQASAGVTAQQAETVDAIKPFVINGAGDEDYKAFDYNALLGYMGKAIQEQQVIINAQQAALTQLQADVAALKGQA